MAVAKEWNCMGWTWLVLLLALAVRLILCSKFLLVPDEVNYWQWSRYLDIGYYDHPPMIAWVIWLSTKFFGQNEFAVRLPTILGLTVASVYMALLAGRWFSWRSALHLVILSQGLLLFNGIALIATPDGVLLPCWAASCYHGGRALERGSTGQWLLTGIWFGLGMLSKYTMLLFIPSLLLYLLLYNKQRKRLLTAGPWIGLIISIAVFSPVIIWNSKNQWATFRHVFYMGGINSETFFTHNYVADFIGSQAALLSPFVLIMILIAWSSSYKHKRLRYDDAKYLVWTSLTTFLIFLLLSLHTRVYGNWPAPGYITALILISSLYSPGRISYKSHTHNSLWKITTITAYLITTPVLVQVVYPALPIPAQQDRIAKETVGWQQLGQKVYEQLQKLPDPKNSFIFGLRYQIASELAFYTPGQPRTVAINRWNRPNVYDYWFDDAMLIGKDAVGVSRHKDIYKHLSKLFTRLERPVAYKIYRHSPWRGDELVKTLYIYVGYGFKGGLRWQPRGKNDIRATDKLTGMIGPGT